MPLSILFAVDGNRKQYAIAGGPSAASRFAPFKGQGKEDARFRAYSLTS